MSTRYDMGFKVNGTPIPDPSGWAYEIADLDVSGERDATGLLHRDRVATKVNYSLEWRVLTWEELQVILSAVNADKFTLVAPDPRTFLGKYTGDYYVGNRSGDAHFYLPERDYVSVYSLKLKFIEY